MTTTTTTDLGAIPIDSGRLLLVDPANMPPALVERLTHPNRHGVTLAAVLNVPGGDGWAPVFSDSEALVVLAPYETEATWQPTSGTTLAGTTR